jgi:ribosomal protein L16 Arg81 hydroxylase
MVLMGEAGAGMFNHVDTLQTASWQAQIEGRKRWHLCAPSQTPHLYEAGDVDAFRCVPMFASDE